MLKTVHLVAQSAGHGQPPTDKAGPQANDPHSGDRGYGPGKQGDRTEEDGGNRHAGKGESGTGSCQRTSDTGVSVGTHVPASRRDRTLEITPEKAFSESGEIIKYEGL